MRRLSSAKENEARSGYVTTVRRLSNPTSFAGVELPAGTTVVTYRERSVLLRMQRVTKSLRKAPKLESFAGGLASRAPAVKAQIDPEAFAPSPRAKAILQGVEAARGLLADAGGTYDLEQVQLLLNGISRQAVDKRVQEGSLLALPGPSNRRVFPTIQFSTDGSVLPGLKEIRAALSSVGPWSVLQFLASPHEDLSGARPVDLLKANRVPEVLEAAHRFDLQGA